MGGQRFYWLKLNKDFFKSKRIKKLRKLAGGDTFTIIYLKMQLLATPTEGVLTYTGLEETVAEEIALDIDEDPENVKITLQYLLKTGLCEMINEKELFLPFVVDNTGSEGSSAKRVREFRSRQKALQCNTSVTDVKPIVNGEIEIEKEIEKDKEIYIEKNSKVKHKYGEFKHVTLTDDQYQKLVEDYGEAALLEGIKNVDEYCEEKGKTYKNYNLTLRKWGIKSRPLPKHDLPPEESIDPEEEAKQKAWEEGFHDA
jgi:predicted phage replisome organizer